MGRRLVGSLRDLGVACRVKHGDSPTLPDSKETTLLVTTPESFDSLLSRRPRRLRNVKTVIIDEVHVLDGTYRGDQIRCLLRRVPSPEGPLSIHMLSATVGDPIGTAFRYAPDPEVICVPGRRRLEYDFVESLGEACSIARRAQWRKLLVFCNMRESVEMAAAHLAKLWAPYPVVAHHGSLHKKERTDAEMVMRESPVAICVSTSTLEIGIDIGSIDAVVLAEPPWSISSLMQRVGRGGRRSGTMNTLALVSSPEERLVLEGMLRQAQTGAVEIGEYTPDRSVVVQQCFSMLFGNPGGLDVEKLSWAVEPLTDVTTLLQILCELEREGWVERRQTKFWATTRLMDLGSRGRGRIHSNISDESAYEVVVVGSNQIIGHIGDPFDGVFTLARRAWKVVKVDWNKRIISVEPYPLGAPPPGFQRTRGVGAFQRWLPVELR